MELIKAKYVVTLETMIILISAIELIAPDNSMKKYLKICIRFNINSSYDIAHNWNIF